MTRPLLLDVRIYEGPEQLARAATDEVANAAADAVATRGRFRLALAGGTTPKRLYELLADATGPGAPLVPWASTELFFSDERCVPADHADSNFRTAREALLDRLRLAPAAVHRVTTELADPAACAAGYEATLRAAFATEGQAWPRFDSILLGMGADGHTASLFPGSSAVEESGKLVIATRVDERRGHRITFTLPLINQARTVLFLVAGADKARSLARVLSPEQGDALLPAGRVRPEAGRVIWLVDAAAAGGLQLRASREAEP